MSRISRRKHQVDPNFHIYCQSRNKNNKNSKGKEKLTCNHCGMNGHTVEKNSNSASTSFTFTQEQCQLFLAMLGINSTSMAGKAPQLEQETSKRGLWHCSVCTYDNDEGLSACDICGVLNPSKTGTNIDKQTDSLCLSCHQSYSSVFASMTIDRSVLTEQVKHQSELLWNPGGQDPPGTLDCRSRHEELTLRGPIVDDCVLAIVRLLGLKGAICTKNAPTHVLSAYRNQIATTRPDQVKITRLYIEHASAKMEILLATQLVVFNWFSEESYEYKFIKKALEDVDEVDRIDVPANDEVANQNEKLDKSTRAIKPRRCGTGSHLLHVMEMLTLQPNSTLDATKKEVNAGRVMLKSYKGCCSLEILIAELAECLERDGFKSVIEAVGAGCR
nr:hypothetical protein CFP56_18011 [Quercus suber]